VPVGPYKGNKQIGTVPGQADKGWIYIESTGVIFANTLAVQDATGKLYTKY